jgi:hypothetical protein
LGETTVNRSFLPRRQVGWFVLAIAAIGAGAAANVAQHARTDRSNESFAKDFKPRLLGKIPGRQVIDVRGLVLTSP